VDYSNRTLFNGHPEGAARASGHREVNFSGLRPTEKREFVLLSRNEYALDFEKTGIVAGGEHRLVVSVLNPTAGAKRILRSAVIYGAAGPAR